MAEKQRLALIADNLDIGRPANVEIIFRRHIRRDTPGVFRTAIDRPAVGPDTGGVVLKVFYQHSRVKQYLNDGRAKRIETVINAPATRAATPASAVWMSFRPGPVRATGAHSTLSAPARHRPREPSL